MPTKRPSSPELHAVPVRREVVELTVVAENVARELTPEALERDVRIKLRARGAPAVLGDPTELFRALACLVGNSIRHAPRGTTVLLQVEAASGRALVDVLDEGAAVAAGLRAVVFQPFFVASPEQGGLAFTTARNIVHGHGGQIAFVECDFGHVRVELPLAVDDTPPARN